MRQITRREHLHYQFDNTMSKGPIIMIAWLTIFSTFLIVAVSLVVFLTQIDESQRSFSELLWVGLMRTMDAGAVGGDTGRWQFLLAMMVTTVGGILFFSILIGIFTTGLESKLEQLRKGRSFVAEQGHTVILGWSPQIFMVVSELVIANANQRHACIAVLGEKDKVEMEEEIRARVSNTGHTRIVCRTGSPIDLADLALVNPQDARAIIILSPEDDNPDIHVVKTILALTSSSRDATQSYHIVAAIRDEKNVEVARLAGGNNIELVLSGNLIARIAAQTCRQSGLSVVYTELLDFDGDEIYFHHEPQLVGKTFGEALLAYADSAVIGVFHEDGRIQLNPPMETTLALSDQMIVIAQDDNTIHLTAVTGHVIDEQAIRAATSVDSTPERTLILGWNDRAPTIIAELDNYVRPGSIVTVVAEIEGWQSANAHLLTCQNQTVTYQLGDTNDRVTLDALQVQTYDYIIVLSYSDTMDVQKADACTLVTLLHLRQISDTYGNPFSIVSEMLDTRNRQLAEAAQPDDFIISDRLISLMLAQVAENKRLTAVFQDLFDPEGSEIYLKPASDFVQLGTSVNFYTVTEAARRQGAVAIGYRLNIEAHNPITAYGVKINPDKSQIINFTAEDQIVVLAEN
jgi:voltage-gated potassium channel Kch